MAAESSQGSVGDTLDGATRASAEPAPATPPAPVSPVHDYPALVEVERHHYVISGEIAKGGMGRVLEARDRRLGRAVAIKELLPKNRAAARRFEREARITARLQHPAIIHVHEAGVWSGGEPFYAMPKVSGRSLDKVVAERVTLAERLGLLPNVIAVVDALAYAHSQNVIHRDLKPSNVLVGEFGETVVIDWGLAKDLGAPSDPMQSIQFPVSPPEETLTGSVVGTPAYMPPEQARGDLVDQRADVYSLGALLYHVLVGKAPYVAQTSKDVLRAVIDGAPPAVAEVEPGAPADLTTIVAKAMARDPAERYATAGELAADLKRFQTGQLVAAHHYSRGQLLWRWLRRHRVAVLIGLLALIALATVAVISVRKIFEERSKVATAQQINEARRSEMLAERGRVELLAGRAGQALVNMLGAVRGQPDGSLGFLIADAVRAFEAEVATFTAGSGPVIAQYRPDGNQIATSSGGVFLLWTADGTPLSTVDVPGAGRLAWDPTGTRVAVGSSNGTIRIISADGTKVAALLQGHTGAITDLEFSRDGARLVSASVDGSARLWDADTGNEIFAMFDGANTSTIATARLSPDGVLVVAAGIDGSATVWDTRRRTAVAPLRGHTAEIRIALWSPAGDRVLTASLDGSVQIWNPLQGKPIIAPLSHEGAVIQAAAWSSDGTRVLTGGADRTGRIWQLPDEVPEQGAQLAARPIATLQHTDAVIAVTFSRDDRWIATAGRVARVWDSSGQAVAAFELADAVVSVELSPDGRRLLTGTTGGNARLWDVTRGLEEPVELDSPVHALTLASTGRIAAGTDDSRVTVWGAGKPRITLREHLGRVFAAAFSPNGELLVTAGEDRAARLWTMATGAVVQLPVGPAAIRSAAFAPDGGSLALTDAAGSLWVWSAAGELIHKESTAGPMTGVKPGSSTAAVVVRGTVAALTCVAFSRNGQRMVTTSESGTLRVHDRDGRIVAVADLGIGLSAAAFDPEDDQRLIVGGAGEAQIWRIAETSLALERSIEGPTGDVRAVAFTADGTRVITAGTDGIARIWDAHRGKLLGTRDPHGGPIDAIAVAPGDSILWTGSADGTARAWDIHAVSDTTQAHALASSRVPWRLGADDIVRRVNETRGR